MTKQKPPTDKKDKKEHRKRKKQAKKALLAFLKRLRGLCKKFDSVNKWLERVEQLENLLVEYDDVFDEEERKGLKLAAKLQDSTRAGIRAACKILTAEIEKTLAGMAVGLTLSSVAIATLIVTAVIVGVVVGVSKFPIEITIHNEGCSEIPLGEEIPLSVRVAFESTVGNIPNSIDTYQEETLEVPRLPLNITMEMVDSGNLELRLGPITIPIDTEAEGIEFDGEDVLAGPVTKRLTEESEHTVIFTCP